MDKKIYSVFVSLSLVVIVVLAFAASGYLTLARAQVRQTSRRRESGAKPAKGLAQEAVSAPINMKLTDEESRMAQGSRAAIIAAGFSESYFDAHFRLSHVVNSANDRRILWHFSIGEYSAVVIDSLGFYTDEKGGRVDTHSARATLHSAHDVLHVISKWRAKRIMRSCIGAYANGAVVLQADGADGQTALVFIATSMPKLRRKEWAERAERERRERAKKSRSGGPPGQSRMDAVENEGDEGDDEPIYIGAVNLETGRCTKGQAISEHPSARRKG
ncbi:MAG: hypothetical protein QOE33_898 [Acidobacteriota bacterium]|nr:hypothetical protein [Acidobacteriota bacterium]